MATGIRIGWRKLTMLAAVQIAAPTRTMRRTTKQAVSAAHIVLRCHGVGYSFMLDGQTLNSQRPAFQSPTTVGSPSSNVDVGYLPCRAQRTLRCLMFGVGRAHYVGFVFTGKSLPIVFLVPSIFSARFLFFGSSASAFCHDSNASGTRFNFK